MTSISAVVTWQRQHASFRIDDPELRCRPAARFNEPAHLSKVSGDGLKRHDGVARRSVLPVPGIVASEYGKPRLPVLPGFGQTSGCLLLKLAGRPIHLIGKVLISRVRVRVCWLLPAACSEPFTDGAFRDSQGDESGEGCSASSDEFGRCSHQFRCEARALALAVCRRDGGRRDAVRDEMRSFWCHDCQF